MADIVAGHQLVLAEPKAQVQVSELTENGIKFNVLPWVKAGDFGTVKADIIEQVKLAFDANDISTPYPKMDINLNKAGAEQNSQTEQ